MAEVFAAQGMPAAVLISGRGSNMLAILDAASAGELPIDVRAVISNRPQAAGLQKARDKGVHTEVVNQKDYPDRKAFEDALRETIDRFAPGLVLLAGFMRVLSAEFVEHYSGRMLNIHPSLLPDLPGLHTHERALEAGLKEHGASVHFVTADVDSGPVIIQAHVPIKQNDDPDRLAARVLQQEHRIYPLAARWFAEGRLELRNGQAVLDGEPLPDQGVTLLLPEPEHA